MKHNTLVAGLLAGSLGLFGAGVGYAAAGTHTEEALEHAQEAAKQSLLEDIQEHAQVSLTHVQAAEEAKEAGSEHLTAAKTALYDALRAKDAGSAKKAVESAESLAGSQFWVIRRALRLCILILNFVRKPS